MHEIVRSKLVGQLPRSAVEFPDPIVANEHDTAALDSTSARDIRKAASLVIDLARGLRHGRLETKQREQHGQSAEPTRTE